MSTGITVIVVVVVLLGGGGIGFAIARLIEQAKGEVTNQPMEQRLAERDTQLTELKGTIDNERRTTNQERTSANNKIEELQRELRSVSEDKAKLIGASESLDSLKAQIEAKDRDISERSERITTLSTENAHYKTIAEETTYTLDKERRTANEEWVSTNSKIEKLQLELRNVSAERAKLIGAGESLDALKAQIETKDKEISGHFERITTLSSQNSIYKTTAEGAIRAKEEAIASKTAEIERTIKDKEEALTMQIAEIRASCDRQLADKESAATVQIESLRQYCVIQLADKDSHIEAQLAEKDRHIEAQKQLLAAAEERLTATFDSLSVKTLTTVSEQFMQTARATLETAQTEAKGDLNLKQQAIEELLRPVSDSLAKLAKQQEEMEQKRVSAFDSIEKGIRTLSEEADQLANALRKPATRGAWGEMNLKVILDNAGLQEGEHYVLQDSTDDEEGNRLRTDVIIHLPNGRDFIIDSKAPLESYWEGMNCPDEATRQDKFAHHAKLVRDHVKQLSSKEYWTRYKASPDCVVMFIPTEGAYQAAIEADRSVLTDAHKSRVYLSNPMTLISMIHIVAYVLKEDRARQNASEIQESAVELYKRVSKFVGDFSDIGRRLRLTVDMYNTAVGALEGRVLPKARDISRLGAGSGREIDDVSPLELFPRELTSPEFRELPKQLSSSNGFEGEA